MGGAAFFSTTEQPSASDDAFEDASSNMSSIPNDATPELLRRIAEDAIEAASRANAALNAVISSNGARDQQRRKKPDLPAFDKDHIEIWIRRVKAAYQRENITDPKDKFAFLESTIGVNVGPTINAFLFGDATADNWEAFLEHLVSEFGRTKAQRVATILDGIRRDGRRPTALLALIEDRSEDVTLDDIKKEMVLRELPAEVCRTMQDKVDLLSAKETAELADAHFDQAGRLLNASATPAVNSMEPVVDELDGSGAPISAVQQRNFNGHRNFGKTQKPSFTPVPTFAADSGPSNQRQVPSNASSKPLLCLYHQKHGDAAIRCERGCSRFKTHAGNGRGGRR